MVVRIRAFHMDHFPPAILISLHWGGCQRRLEIWRPDR